MSADSTYKKMAIPQYTLEEIAKHNTPDDLWIIISGSVYDVTAYIQKHPGGVEALHSVAGTDATKGFRKNKNHLHIATQRDLRNFMIGVVAKPEKGKWSFGLGWLFGIKPGVTKGSGTEAKK
ncbi:cytochrome b5 [Mollisia scopiformis]|uniref:Cytochrome b5 n=1 Tax=Mollisia scopiformis TaxID=149040 RepID=A0A194XW17_MOLSC|nr:cytochrome b5 [Mollisia scopiformis]KUJ24505.1 cytochrome b5 [Mollisia scopiformis]